MQFGLFFQNPVTYRKFCLIIKKKKKKEYSNLLKAFQVDLKACLVYLTNTTSLSSEKISDLDWFLSDVFLMGHA